MFFNRFFGRILWARAHYISQGLFVVKRILFFYPENTFGLDEKAAHCCFAPVSMKVG